MNAPRPQLCGNVAGKRRSGLLGRYLLLNRICIPPAMPDFLFLFLLRREEGEEMEERRCRGWGAYVHVQYIQVMINGVVEMSVLVIIYPKKQILIINLENHSYICCPRGGGQ